MAQFSCVECQKTYPLESEAWRCECGGVLEMTGLPTFDRQAILQDEYTLWRYRHMFPFIEDEQHIVSLGEGFTPLVRASIYGVPVLAKMEYMAPTGSYKDRGAAVLVSFLNSRGGVKSVVEDSSGNAAASLCAYAARAGIKARIFVPANASPSKLQQIAIYGGELHMIEGPRMAAAEAAHKAAQKEYYASHVYSPIFMTGLRSFAYEVAEQLGWQAPDNLVFPVGHGTFLLGTYRGFQDLLAAGLIHKMPRFFAVQSRACAPIFQAYRRGSDDVSAMMAGDTIAEGIRIAHPPRGPQVLEAIRQTDGAVLTVTDAEVIRAQRTMARIGLFVEPTSAVAGAGLRKLDRILGEGEVTVIPLTGSGLKAPVAET
jgi:threonine synthase